MNSGEECNNSAKPAFLILSQLHEQDSKTYAVSECKYLISSSLTGVCYKQAISTASYKQFEVKLFSPIFNKF